MTDFKREGIPLLSVTIRERTMAKGININMGDPKYPCVCRRSKLSGKGVHNEKVREIGRR